MPGRSPSIWPGTRPSRGCRTPGCRPVRRLGSLSAICRSARRSLVGGPGGPRGERSLMSGSERGGLALEASDGAFRLNVLGYQYPGAPFENGDWLMIEGQASASERSWEFRDPCMTAGEL